MRGLDTSFRWHDGAGSATGGYGVRLKVDPP